MWKILHFEYVHGPWPGPYLGMQLEAKGAGCSPRGLVVKGKDLEAVKMP